VRYNSRAVAAAYWLVTVGLVIMVSDLTIAGVVQGRLWQTDAPWIVSVEASRPYWVARTLSGVPLAAGFIALLVGLTTGRRGAGLRSIAGIGGHEAVPHVQPQLAVATVSTSEVM
jgi:cbb3-type cytochrome oxidase subunit 1